MNATYGNGTAVHSLNDKGAAHCGAGVSRASGSGITKVADPKLTEAAATCKRCAKFAAGLPVIAPKLPARRAHLQAPAPVATTKAWCHICDEKLEGTVDEIRNHVRNCKG